MTGTTKKPSSADRARALLARAPSHYSPEVELRRALGEVLAELSEAQERGAMLEGRLERAHLMIADDTKRIAELEAEVARLIERPAIISYEDVWPGGAAPETGRVLSAEVARLIEPASVLGEAERLCRDVHALDVFFGGGEVHLSCLRPDDTWSEAAG
ncbi:MAG TPA: hypothetical protein VGF45_06380, partial [Polyangia bacterium]